MRPSMPSGRLWTRDAGPDVGEGGVGPVHASDRDAPCQRRQGEDETPPAAPATMAADLGHELRGCRAKISGPGATTATTRAGRVRHVAA